MTTPDESVGRIERNATGMGEVSDEMIERRAREIAVQEGRNDIMKSDRQRALLELQGSGGTRSDDETDVRATTLNPQEPAGTPGHKAPTSGPASERNVIRELVQEGIDEAAHEQMTAAEKEARRKEKS
jgi:hypothetical protein